MTLSDFPGLTAAIVFTQGCNFRCPFCHNGSLLDENVPDSKLLNPEKVLDALKHRKKMLDGLVITGGEPTIQADLLPFIKEVRSIGYNIKLDTNGSRPEVIETLIDNEVLDYIAMDIKAPFHKYSRLAGVKVITDDIRQSIAIIGKCNVVSEFRTTYIPSLLTKSDMSSISSMAPKKSKYTVQKFLPENALDSSLRKTVNPVRKDAPVNLSQQNNPHIPMHIDFLAGE